MQQTKRTPTFNMKAVVLETGLKPDTLRAWERRYQLPQPKRTSGGHRLYSRKDIQTVKWLMARQEEGLTISRAVELWHRFEDQGQDPLLIRAVTGEAQQQRQARQAVAGETVAKLRQSWVSYCQAFDEQGAEQTMAEAFALFAPEQVCSEILQKGLAQMGDRWYRGETTVQQEHFASALASRRIASMISGAPAPSRPGRILVGCPPGEEHTIGALLLTFQLRRDGWEVVYLGANVPLDRLEPTLKETNVQLVIFSAQLLDTAASLLEVARLAQALEIRLAYGGRIFNALPEVRRHIPGHFLGMDLALAPRIVEQLMTTRQPVPSGVPPSSLYRDGLVHFRDRRDELELAVNAELQFMGLSPGDFTVACGQLADAIIAALVLGDMAALDSEISWLRGLMSNRKAEAAQLNTFLQVYYKVSESQLDERGRPILAWLAKYSNDEGHRNH